MLYASDMLAPLELLGPIANYVFLRYVGGDKENEAGQEERYSASGPQKKKDFDKYRQEKNSIWPDAGQVRVRRIDVGSYELTARSSQTRGPG